ncbi:hypothetical protein [Paraburkholderia sediminicola]|uniref:hypothetical protein n=1 Tax=Paraburkholderia sediminicola TaxID=458836 RepID=UPI0038BCF8B8
MPENHAGAVFLLMEKVEFIAQYTMIDIVHSHAPFGLMLQILQIDAANGGPETPKAPSVSGGAFGGLPQLLASSVRNLQTTRL